MKYTKNDRSKKNIRISINNSSNTMENKSIWIPTSSSLLDLSFPTYFANFEKNHKIPRRIIHHLHLHPEE